MISSKSVIQPNAKVRIETIEGDKVTVIEATARSVSIESNPEFESFSSDYYYDNFISKVSDNITLTADLNEGYTVTTRDVRVKKRDVISVTTSGDVINEYFGDGFFVEEGRLYVTDTTALNDLDKVVALYNVGQWQAVTKNGRILL